MEEDTTKKADVNTKASKPRCRMKKLLNNIQELLDFYFSDVNLNHDRFLRKEVEKDPDGYVDLSTMLRCNKLKQLTSDVTILAKAVGNSSRLELNDEHTKVKRKEKLQELENVDLRTVYVEEFPANTDHDWLKSVFTTCGSVKYISLPKFKHNNQVKGFAFIEFNTTDGAHKACQVLNTIQCKHKKRLSTTSSNGDSSAKKKNKKRRSNSECENNGSALRQNTKRRRSVSESSEGSPVKTNRRKRRSSFCSIDENDIDNSSSINVNENQGVEKKSNDIVLTFPSTKKKRSRDSSVSSEGESRHVKISDQPKTVIEITNTDKETQSTISTKTKKENTDIGENEGATNTSPAKTSGRKRKASDSTEDETKKIPQTPQCEVLKSCDVDSSNDAVFICQDVVSKSHDKTEACEKNSNSQNVICHDKCGDLQKECMDSHDTHDSKNTVADSSTNDEPKVRENKRKISSDKECEHAEKKIKVEESNEKCKEELEKQKDGDEKEDECGECGDNKQEKKKKNRQHKKKGDKSSNNEAPKIPPLHVIPKCEWLTLKKEYKRLQRIKMSELKRNLKVLKSEQVRRTELKERIYKTITAKSETTELINENVDVEKADFEKEKETFISTVGAKVENESNIKAKGLELTSGTVVALKTSSENLTRTAIKSTLSSFGQLSYIDYVDGVYQGFVRFASTGDLEKVMSLDDADKQTWVFQLRKLDHEEENEYFQKAEEKRRQTYDKSQRKRRKKGRGIDKITRDRENISNHIHFS